jgi:hypothetical protein
MSRVVLAAILVKRAEDQVNGLGGPASPGLPSPQQANLEAPAIKYNKAGPKGGGWKSPQQQIDTSDAYLKQRSQGGASGITGGLLSSLLGGVAKPAFNPDQARIDLVNSLSAQKSTTDKQPVAAPAQPTWGQEAQAGLEQAPTQLPSEPSQDLYAPEKQQLANDISKGRAEAIPQY